MLRVLIAVASIGVLVVAAAGDVAVPSATQVREAIEASRAAIDTARRAPPISPVGTGRLEPLDSREPPASGATLAPGTGRDAGVTADLRALMERARAGTHLDARAAPANGPRLLVFVSLAMPGTSLRALLEQARPAGAALVLRGLLDDSMSRTAEWLVALLGGETRARDRNLTTTDLPLMIDPTLFERFGVTAVPAFVLPRAAPTPCDAAGRCPTPAHLKLAGDVTLAYALGMMSREASDPALRAAAGRLARRMEAPR